jgi:hypothetical protein
MNKLTAIQKAKAREALSLLQSAASYVVDYTTDGKDRFHALRSARYMAREAHEECELLIAIEERLNAESEKSQR